MSRYIGDQNKVLFQYESGTYASTSGTGHWVGLVQDHAVTDDEGVQTIRYGGTSTRNVDLFVDGPRNHTGNLTFFPQDWKFLGFALGSTVDAGSPSPYTHVLSEIDSAEGNAYTSGIKNPFFSFTIEDSKTAVGTGQNFVRTLKGCNVDTWRVSASQGDIVNCEVTYRAQSNTYTSGASTAVTAATTRPFLWHDIKVHIPSGTVIDEVKDFSLSINNNLNAPHYLNGSRDVSVPIPENRDYELTLTIDASSERNKTLYDQYFRGGSLFNAMVELTDVSAGAGSRDCFISLSGCRLNVMDTPSPIEGVNDQTLTINPKTVSVAVNDAIQLYNPW